MISSLCMDEMSPPLHIIKEALRLTKQRVISKGSHLFLVKDVKPQVYKGAGYSEVFDSVLSQQIDSLWMQLKRESTIVAERNLLVEILRDCGLSSMYCYDIGSHFIFLPYKSYEYRMVLFGNEVFQSLACGHLPLYNGLHWSIVKC